MRPGGLNQISSVRLLVIDTSRDSPVGSLRAMAEAARQSACGTRRHTAGDGGYHRETFLNLGSIRKQEVAPSGFRRGPGRPSGIRPRV